MANGNYGTNRGRLGPPKPPPPPLAPPPKKTDRAKPKKKKKKDTRYNPYGQGSSANPSNMSAGSGG